MFDINMYDNILSNLPNNVTFFMVCNGTENYKFFHNHNCFISSRPTGDH